jgi:hypothetical protein
MMRACQACGRELVGRRAHARFCSSGCRVDAHRGTDRRRQNGRQSRVGAQESVTNARHVSRAGAQESVTKPFQASNLPPEPESTLCNPYAPILRASKPAPKLDPRIVADVKWPGLYRLRFPDGSLSDMANLTRVKDALRAMLGAA